jgi:hypothetical protein
MPYADFENEKDAIDHITDAMFALDFLKFYTDSLANPSINQKSIEYFYSFWLGNRQIPLTQPKIPFNMGAILGYLYVGILFAKEGWYSLIPQQSLIQSASWGVETLTVSNPSNPDIKLNGFARRIRNALGHGRIKINVPMDGSFTPDNVEDTVSITFNDVGRDPSDTFEVTMKIIELEKFIKQFQSLIHDDVSSRAR